MSANLSQSWLISAPIDGLCVPVHAIPDPVFSQEMLGSTVAIEPLGDHLCAPAAGTVIQCAPTRHSVTLKLADGVEILLHLGVDTVKLNGEGLSLLVKPGDYVTEGTPLIRFNVDKVAVAATSLITPLIFVGEKPLRLIALATGRVAMGAPFARLVAADAAHTGSKQPDAGAAKEIVEASVEIALENGLHARPASRLKAVSERYQADVFIRNKAKTVSVSRIAALLDLGLMYKDKVVITAGGAQAAQAIAEIRKILETPEGVTSGPALSAACRPDKNQTFPETDILQGLVASPGYAIGLLRFFKPALPAFAEYGKEAEIEKQHLQRAIKALQTQLRDKAQAAENTAQADILAAHRALLDDDELLAEALAQIQAGKSAAFAWKTIMDRRIEALARSANPLIRERTADLRDIQLQLISLLPGNTAAEPAETDKFGGAIIAAEDITPSQFMMLAAQKPAALCLAYGGITSHVAILCRSKNIPCLMGLGKAVLDPVLLQGHTVILDGDKGIIQLKPTVEQLATARRRQELTGQNEAKAKAESVRPAVSKDGRLVLVAANIAGALEAENSLINGADAVGLFRSEFLFLGRDSAPSAEEQQQQYQAAVDAMQGRPVIIRTLDIGADKQLSWLKIGGGPNPALGIRGARLILTNPELMSTQLTALLRVKAKPLKNGKSPVQIMVPMVTDIHDFIAVRAMMEELAGKLGIDKREDFLMPQLGAMIEVPSAALMAANLAREADFFSVGTNDLTQYTLAMDREETKLSARLDVLHPAVLRLIAFCCAEAAKQNCPVGICGAAAADTVAGPVLAALGAEELSMESPHIAAAKARLRQIDLAALKAECEKALTLADGAAVRENLGRWLAAQIKTS
ncbi:MAG: phosphoenolpyruvate--protein phosphotransferase [Candidatus Tokpelaia sp.]|nr:MAG: phosphoenolpyruvate--protein phosphotransferase [Candidatus Tokpelaia sp.]KAA6206951.1 MAG: phosphoenolpyruvate--protein phosphotransferase [Candidatus Tokpelaia sp.]